MSRTTGIFLTIVVCAVLAAVVFGLTDFLGGKVYASPEEVFNASRAAINKNDLRTWGQCLTEETRDVMAAKPIIYSFNQIDMAPTKEDKATLVALVDVQKNHGLTESFLAKLKPEADAMRQRGVPNEALVRFAQKVLAPVSDRNAFFAEMYAVIFNNDAAANLPVFADGKLARAEIDGQMAMGVVTQTADKGPGIQLVFRKQGESWRIDLLASQELERLRLEGGGFKHPPIER